MSYTSAPSTSSRLSLAIFCGGIAAALLVVTVARGATVTARRKKRHPDEEDDVKTRTVPQAKTKANATAVDCEDDTHELEDLASALDERDRWALGEVRRPVRISAAAEEDEAEEYQATVALPGKQRLFVKTQGCAHNSSDSEFMMGLLRDYGYGFVNAWEDADALLINSCTVKGPSQDTATNLVKRARDAGKAVVLAGCVPTADGKLASSLEGVSLLGVTQIDRVVEVVEEALKGNEMRLLTGRRGLPSLELPKVRKNRFVEIIPISGGCLGNCSYCKTKHARGKLLSYPPEALLARVRRAVEEGVSEVWLTSEDTGAYGLDIGTNIAVLLHRIADALPPNVMLKFGMTNPPYMLEHIEAVAEVMNRPNVFAFIHIPVQSGSDAVLQAMIREYTIADFKRLVDGLRDRVPDLLVATDVICGFPAESEESHQETMELVRHYKFPVLNISQFYPRPGTAAARMRKLPTADVKRRSVEMSALFNSYETFQGLVGRVERVWFCESDPKHQQTVGHTKGYVKIVVPRDDGLLGRSSLVRLESATKWHVQGVVVEASS